MPAQASQLIVNGGFETGDLQSWTTDSYEFIGGHGSRTGQFLVTSASVTPDSGFATVGPRSGSYYALSDQVPALGLFALYQNFPVSRVPAASVQVSFSMFVNNRSTTQTSVEVSADFMYLTGTTPVASGVSLVSILNPPPGTQPYTDYSFDVTSLYNNGCLYGVPCGIQFIVEDLDVVNVGIDNVNVELTPVNTVPEPSTAGLFFLGAAGLGVTLLRRAISGVRVAFAY